LDRITTRKGKFNTTRPSIHERQSIGSYNQIRTPNGPLLTAIVTSVRQSEGGFKLHVHLSNNEYHQQYISAAATSIIITRANSRKQQQ
jgi:hypothetical protein